MFLNLEPSTTETKEEDSLNFTFANNKKVSGTSSPPPTLVSVPSCEVVSGKSFISSLVKKEGNDVFSKLPILMTWNVVFIIVKYFRSFTD